MDKPKQWFSYIQWVEFAYDVSFCEGAHATPLELVHGRKPPTIPMTIGGSSRLEAVGSNLTIREELLSALKKHLLHAQE